MEAAARCCVSPDEVRRYSETQMAVVGPLWFEHQSAAVVVELWGLTLLTDGGDEPVARLFSVRADRIEQFIMLAGSTDEHSLVAAWRRWVRMHARKDEKWLIKDRQELMTKCSTQRAGTMGSFERDARNLKSRLNPTVNVRWVRQAQAHPPLLDGVKALHHGTTLSDALRVLRGIKLTIGLESELDYGNGFYLTSNFDAAAAWARRRDEDNAAVVTFLLEQTMFDTLRQRFLSTAESEQVLSHFRYGCHLGEYNNTAEEEADSDQEGESRTVDSDEEVDTAGGTDQEGGAGGGDAAAGGNSSRAGADSAGGTFDQEGPAAESGTEASLAAGGGGDGVGGGSGAGGDAGVGAGGGGSGAGGDAGGDAGAGGGDAGGAGDGDAGGAGGGDSGGGGGGGGDSDEDSDEAFDQWLSRQKTLWGLVCNNPSGVSSGLRPTFIRDSDQVCVRPNAAPLAKALDRSRSIVTWVRS